MTKTAEMKCKNCVYLRTKSSYCCADSFCSDVDMICTKTNKLISGCETIFNASKITAPDWCPLRTDEIEDATKDSKKGMKYELSKLREKLIIEHQKEQQNLMKELFDSIKDRIYEDCKKKAENGKFTIIMTSINSNINPIYHEGIIRVYLDYFPSLRAFLIEHFGEIFKNHEYVAGEEVFTLEW